MDDTINLYNERKEKYEYKTDNEFEKYYINTLEKDFAQPSVFITEGIKTRTKEYAVKTYRRLHENVIRYKEGDREAGEYIVKTFHYFITKYTRFIVNGDIPSTQYMKKDGSISKRVSPTISSFVGLYVEGGMKGLPKEARHEKFMETAKRIKKLYSKYEYFDIYNELVLALMNMANKYKVITDKNDPYYKENGTFHMYVSRCFHWEAQRFLKPLIKDPLAHLNMLTIYDSFDDLEFDLENGLNTNGVVLYDEGIEENLEKIAEEGLRRAKIRDAEGLKMKEDEDITVFDNESLNFNWCMGYTSGKEFEGLTPFQREMIIDIFVYHMKIQELMVKYTCRKAVIMKNRDEALNIIKNNVSRIKSNGA